MEDGETKQQQPGASLFLPPADMPLVISPKITTTLYLLAAESEANSSRKPDSHLNRLTAS